MNHTEAHRYIVAAVAQVFEGEAPPCVTQILQAMAKGEGNYGTGWGQRLLASGRTDSPRNWGAIQVGRSWTGDHFTTRDSYVDKDGKTVWYEERYRAYPTHAEGALDLVRLVKTFDLAIKPLFAGDVLGVSRALRLHRAWEPGGERRGYYEGYGASPARRELNHAAMLFRWVIAASWEYQELTGEEWLLPSGAATPQPLRARTALPGDPWLEKLRYICRMTRSGPYPESAVHDFQSRMGITADGDCGAQTWGLLCAIDAENQADGAETSGKWSLT